MYDAFETPRAVRGDAEALGPDEARAYMREVRERTAQAIAQRGVGDGGLCEMVIGTSCSTQRRCARRWRSPACCRPVSHAWSRRRAPDEWIEVPAGSFEMGAPAGGFAYDNERPRHTV